MITNGTFHNIVERRIMNKPEFVICPECGAKVYYSKYFNAYNCLTMFCDWSSFDPPEENELI